MNTPCGTCRACCIGQAVVLQPQDGDPARYEAEPIGDSVRINALSGREVAPPNGLILKRKPNGECVYLSASGCSIYDRRPIVCRSFDCGNMYRKLTPRERREGVRATASAVTVMTAGRRINQWREATERGEAPPLPFGERDDT